MRFVADPGIPSVDHRAHALRAQPLASVGMRVTMILPALGTAAQAGVRLHHARPPIIGSEVELDERGSALPGAKSRLRMRVGAAFMFTVTRASGASTRCDAPCTRVGRVG